MPLKAEQKHDRAHTDRQVEEDRKNVIQAAIVRIMKMRKKLNHNLLVQETIDQVSPGSHARSPHLPHGLQSSNITL